MTILTLLFFILGIALISYGANILVSSTQNISEKYDISEENPEKINEILKIINIHKEKIVFGNDQLESRD